MDHLTRLRAAIARGADLGAGVVQTDIEGVSLMAAESPTDPLHSVARPALAVVAQGAKRTVVGDQVHDYRAGELLIVSIDLPVSAHITDATRDRPFLAFGLELRPAAVAALLLDGAAEPATASSPDGIAVGRASTELLDAILRLLNALDDPEEARVLGPGLEREILWRLLIGPQGAVVRQIGLADSRLSHVARAVGWLRAHYADSISVDELASLAGLSASSFHRHFRAVTTMTPIQYQKRIRLQEARSRLLDPPVDVASVGFGVGYVSASQFSREYRRMFGLPPGQDAKRLRRARDELAEPA
ncbi:Transcriptional regulator AraC family [Patulibacter medicamentivorans]|uniref:Transcriptional regulator AraC family n=1 Tax=Patulibacter medicamentivorans TaxID=1097667 RepID=H0E1X6_9ACTN|nr:AraC family transcriptional regulator [Patulibacter medicamentivorans]EHN12326.1 Transcriptional regulator AraC family [Patulibacter medicamentivorans]